MQRRRIFFVANHGQRKVLEGKLAAANCQRPIDGEVWHLDLHQKEISQNK